MMECSTSSRVLMVRPATFFFNPETAINNSFQIPPDENCDKPEVFHQAAVEFNGLVNVLRSEGVTVEVINEPEEPFTSDSVFPNNWISFHSETDNNILSHSIGENLVNEVTPIKDKTAILYPMWSENRQLERKKLANFARNLLPKDTVILDLSPLENQQRYLEGTGSLVLDRANRIAYACLSPRTTKDAVDLFCRRMGYKAMLFQGMDATGKPCYHTNVLMSIADKYCVICLEAIVDLREKVEVEVLLKNSGKVVIELNQEQVSQFAGNCLQLKGSEGTFLVMCKTAFAALTETQIETIQQFDKIVFADVGTIEKYGGGSVRCMIAELGDAEG